MIGGLVDLLGLVRGERRRQAIRDALKDGRTPPLNPRHDRPAEWRAKVEWRLAEKAAEVEVREREVAEHEVDAATILAFADAVSEGEIDADGRALKPADTHAKRDSPLLLQKANRTTATQDRQVSQRQGADRKNDHRWRRVDALPC